MELELRLTILAIGLFIIALIYLWGIRHRIKESWEKSYKARRKHDYDDVTIETDNGVDDVPAQYYATQHNDSAVSETAPGQTPASRADAVISADRDAPMVRGNKPVDDHSDDHTDNYSDDHLDEADESADTLERNDTPNVLLFVIAPRGKPFQGANILSALQDLELRLNTKGTWSFFADSDSDSDSDSGGEPVFRVGHLKEPGIFDLPAIETLTTPGLVLFMQLPGPLEALAAVDRMIGTAGQLAEKLGGTVCDDHRHKLTPQLISHLRAQAAEYDRRMRVRG
jgi:cell division protein ZipA